MKRMIGIFLFLSTVAGCATNQVRPVPGDFSITAPSVDTILIVKPDGTIIWPKGQKVGLSYILADYQRIQKALQDYSVASSSMPVKGRKISK